MLEVLQSRFHSQRAGDLDAVVEFNWSDGACRVAVHHGEAQYFEDIAQAPAAELVIYFRDRQQAEQIITGKTNPIDAFMAGEFRSNGYIVWVFQTLAAFSGPP